MPHKGHADCIYNSIAACERARREALGQCVADVGDDEPRACRNWATTVIGDRPLCGQHANSYAIQFDAEARRQRERAVIDARITEHMAWVSGHPSVWDPR